MLPVSRRAYITKRTSKMVHPLTLKMRIGLSRQCPRTSEKQPILIFPLFPNNSAQSRSSLHSNTSTSDCILQILFGPQVPFRRQN